MSMERRLLFLVVVISFNDMLVKSCRFDPVVDKTPVSKTGFIDACLAFVNNAIPSRIAESEDDYNGIEDPASILGKPRDVFEAIDMEKGIKQASSKPVDDSDHE